MSQKFQSYRQSNDGSNELRQKRVPLGGSWDLVRKRQKYLVGFMRAWYFDPKP